MQALIHRILRRRARDMHWQYAPILPASGKILDIGSGTGHTGDEILRHSVLQLTETDIADLSLRGRRPQLFDGRSLPFANGAFNTALLLEFLDKEEAPEDLLREALRVARRVVVVQSVPASGSLHGFGARLLRWGYLRLLRMAGFSREIRERLVPAERISAEALHAALAACGGRQIAHLCRGRFLRRHTFILEAATVQQPASTLRSANRKPRTRQNPSRQTVRQPAYFAARLLAQQDVQATSRSI